MTIAELQHVSNLIAKDAEAKSVTYTCGYCGRSWQQEDYGVGRPSCPECALDDASLAEAAQ